MTLGLFRDERFVSVYERVKDHLSPFQLERVEKLMKCQYTSSDAESGAFLEAQDLLKWGVLWRIEQSTRNPRGDFWDQMDVLLNLAASQERNQKAVGAGA